jgi:hypothetical protein
LSGFVKARNLSLIQPPFEELILVPRSFCRKTLQLEEISENRNAHTRSGRTNHNLHESTAQEYLAVNDNDHDMGPILASRELSWDRGDGVSEFAYVEIVMPVE